MDNDELQARFERADQQRALALKNAFSVIDVFAYPSFSPDQFEMYDELKKILFERYKPSVTDWIDQMEEGNSEQ